MNKPIIAIGLDSADPLLLEKWMSQGYLKNINKLRQRGVYGYLTNTVDHCGFPTESTLTERNWVVFNTGCRPNKTGYWDTVKYQASNYKTTVDDINGGYDYKEYAPFYALKDKYRVAAFDMPVGGLSDQLNGVQILGWGGHYPLTPSDSQPPELLPEIIQKYGKNPVLRNDSGHWWDPKFFKWLQPAVKSSISTRAAICRDLLKREPWDLFLTVFGETHTASHEWWHLSQPDHPLYPTRLNHGYVGDPMLDAYEEVDKALGEILAEVPDDAYVLCYAVHGMAPNVTDMLSMMVLPELLYRFNFPGKVAIAPGKVGTTPPPIITNPLGGSSWLGAVWRSKYEPNPIKRFLRRWTPGRLLPSSGLDDLASPYKLMAQSDGLGWMPAQWYHHLWPQMKAFALPAFAEGLIRINLQGREGKGIVTPFEYDALCDELTQMLYRLKDGRTGEPLVKTVVRTREYATQDQDDLKLPPADLVVFWQDQPTDVVDSPDLGRIGPTPYFRTGGHRPRGFLMAKGPGIAPGSNLPEGAEAVDLPPTILELMGAPIPEYFDGKPLLHSLVSK